MVCFQNCGVVKQYVGIGDTRVAFHSHYCSIFPWIHANVYMNFNVL